jgi:imidazolonepropionase-like amidohydrolase
MRTRLIVLVTAAAWSAAAMPQSLPGSAAEVEQFLATKAAVVALEDVRVIDGFGGEPKDHQTIVIANGRIEAVGPSATVKVPAGAERRTLGGRTVLPGLVMLHEHLMYFSGFRIWHSQAVSYPRLFLAAGVTTIRTAGGDFPATDLNVARGVEDGRMAGPRIFVTGPYLNDYDGHFVGDTIVRNEEEGRREVRYWSGRGVTSFKIYARLTADAAKGVIDEAHKLGLPVTGHLGRIGCREAVDLGIANIEHSFSACFGELGGNSGDDGKPVRRPDPAKLKALIDRMVKRGVVLTITPRPLERPLGNEERRLLHPTALANYEAARKRGWPPDLAAEPILREMELQFIAAGGKVVLGSDPQDLGLIAGFANHSALEALVASGTRPLDALRISTVEGARFLKIDRETGSITVGKRADLIVVRGDPSKRISDIRKVEMVFSNGRAFDPSKLIESVEGMVGWR